LSENEIRCAVGAKLETADEIKQFINGRCKDCGLLPCPSRSALEEKLLALTSFVCSKCGEKVKEADFQALDKQKYATSLYNRLKEQRLCHGCAEGDKTPKQQEQERKLRMIGIEPNDPQIIRWMKKLPFNIGDEVLIKAKIVDLDSNPIRPSAIIVELLGSSLEEKDLGWKGAVHQTAVRFAIHSMDQPEVVQAKLLTPENFTVERINDTTLMVSGTKNVFSTRTNDAVIVAYQPIKSAQISFKPTPKELFLQRVTKTSGVEKAIFTDEQLKIYHHLPDNALIIFKKDLSEHPYFQEIKSIEYFYVPSGHVVCEKCNSIVQPIHEEDEDQTWIECPTCHNRWGHTIKPGFG
jgi:hypothetical protein